jgi:hypothetical protein
METVLAGIARRDRTRRALAIALAAVAAAALGIVLVLAFVRRDRDEPDEQRVEAVRPSCPITARVLAAQQTNAERHEWLVTTLRDACSRDRWPDDYLTCVARGGDECASRLAATGRRTSGVFAIADGPIACLSAARAMQRCELTRVEARVALDDLGRALEQGVVPACATLEQEWNERAAQACAPGQTLSIDGPPPVGPPPQVEPGAVGYLSVTSQPPAKILVDHVDTGRTTPASIPLPPGKHRITFVVGFDKYTYPATIRSGKTIAFVKDFR